MGSVNARRLSLAALLLVALGCRPEEPSTPALPLPPPPATSSDRAPEPDPLSAEAAAGVIRAYYDAIDHKDYARAYRAWGGEGASSHQTFESFVRGFAETESVKVEIGPPGRIEGAAGSRYVTVPVAIEAKTTRGTTQRFAGTYVLRRSVVDGATSEQRAWHIDSARISRIGG